VAAPPWVYSVRRPTGIAGVPCRADGTKQWGCWGALGAAHGRLWPGGARSRSRANALWNSYLLTVRSNTLPFNYSAFLQQF
jgi:hypothetical protein